MLYLSTLKNIFEFNICFLVITHVYKITKLIIYLFNFLSNCKCIYIYIYIMNHLNVNKKKL